jgi:aryl-phospho-beta-D-glucosidase BglC (GH1 family)
MKSKFQPFFSSITAIILLVPLLTFAQLSPDEAVSQMRRGINLGNTLEPPHEGEWNNPDAEEYYFDLYRDAGFDVVRIPVRWDGYTSDASPYTVQQSWLNRVEQVVDWALDRDLYVVINAHHEGWIKENYEDKNLRDRFDSIWSQISVKMQDKSEKLLFEIINEPNGLTKAQNNELHQRVLNIIRKTNPTRNVIIQGHNWGGSSELIEMAIPNDPYLIGSFHSYDPYLFGLEGEGTWGSANDYTTLEDKFKSVNNWSEKNNIPVFLGEFGSLRECHYNSRMRHYQAYVELSLKYGFSPCAWDDGGNFRIMERQDREWGEVKDILIYGSLESPNNIQAFVHQDSIIRLAWNNRTENYDSIKIERKTTGGNYHKYTVLEKGTTFFNDIKPEMDKTYYYRIILTHNDETKKPVYAHPIKVYFPEWEVPEREPYHGEAMPIPGTIEAEDYDIGGNGYTYYDTSNDNRGEVYRPDEEVDIYELGGNYYIGGIITGEWYEYSVNIEKSGTYNIEFLTTSPAGGGTFSISFGENINEITVPVTPDWFSPKATSIEMQLEDGQHIMRLSIVDATASFNIDKMVFSTTNSSKALTNSNELMFKAYANYRQSEIKVISDEHIIEKVNLYNANGTLIQAIENNHELKTLSLDINTKGIYIIEGISALRRTVQKVVY